MPQMSPMLWINMYLYTIILMTLLMILLNSLMMYVNNNIKNIKMNLTLFNLKWF
nr:ATP synthase F0 subunit 8 [Muscidifurax sinesensilla]